MRRNADFEEGSKFFRSDRLLEISGAFKGVVILVKSFMRTLIMPSVLVLSIQSQF